MSDDGAAKPPTPETPSRAATPDLRRARWAFVLAAGVTIVLYTIPYGHTLGYPLVLLSTVVHELGHGTGALLTGASFERLLVHADASGAAVWRGDVGRFGRAFIAASGLVGPAVAACLGLLLGRGPRRSRWALGTAGLLLTLVTLFLVRNVFGFLFLAGLAAALIALALRASDGTAQAALVFLAVQLALSVFSRGDYLFTPVARTAAGDMPSDVAVMAQALWLPYWMWGGLCGAFSVALLAVGMWRFLRS